MMINRALLFFLILSLSINSYGQITWGPTAEIATLSFGNNQPKVVMDASGNAMVIWSYAGDAMFSKWNGSGFTTPVVVNQSSVSVAGASWMGPNIYSHGDTVYVVYKETPENVSTSGIWCTSSFNAGASFSTPVRVDNIGADMSRFPTVTTDDLGNPIVAFMRYNSSFASPEWVVTKSNDFGATFSADAIASGWSSPTSEVCDCCPGIVASSGSNVAMLYRDNNSNIRDTWVGISSNGGASFSGGMNVDQQNWLLNSCPSDGPDGLVIGDTVYSIFMNGSGGNYKVYYNKSSLSAGTGSPGISVTSSIPGLTQQNYPHIANSGTAMAMVWRQVISTSTQLAFKYTSDISNGFTTGYDTITVGLIANTDLEIMGNSIMVVWQDNITGTIKYRQGALVTGIVENDNAETISIFPNPTQSIINIVAEDIIKEVVVMNATGKVINLDAINLNKVDVSSLSAGIYLIEITTDNGKAIHKFIKE